MKRFYTERFRVLAVSFAVLLASMTAANAEDDVFKAEDFLTWERENQEYYFQVSIGMASLIAARNEKSQGDCIDNWFFKNRTEASDEILTVMRQYPENHPAGLVLAVLQKHCGTFTYAER